MPNENETNIVIIDQLKVQTNSFDYIQFFKAENQSEYFKNYMYELTNKLASNLKYFMIKREMRNLNWKFLSSSGLLQENFITCIFTIKQLVDNGILSDLYKDAYLPIKIFHYLIPQLLCKYNNLSNIIQIRKRKEIVESSSSSNSSYSSYSSDSLNSYESYSSYESYNSNSSESSNNSYLNDIDQNYQIYEIQFYKHYFNLINEDKQEYYLNSQRIVDPMYYSNADVHLYDFLENKLQYNFNNSCLYTVRSYDKINDDLYSSLSYWTRQRKYVGNVNIVYDDYEIQPNGQQKIVQKSYNKEYITGKQRNVGIDKTELLKNQNIDLDFASKIYSIDQICKYYKFTSKELLNHKDGIILNQQSQPTIYNFNILFKYQTLDTNNSDFKQFYNYHKNNFTDEQLTIFGLYQKIDYTITNNQIIPIDNETYSNLTKYTNGQYSNSYIRTLGVSEKKDGAIYPITKQFLNVTNNWFTSTKIRYNYGSIRGNTISQYYDYLQNITEETDFYKTRTDNILVVNVDQQKKIEMIKRIEQAQGNSSTGIINISIYYPNEFWYNTEYKKLLDQDQNGKFIKLFTWKYDQYYVGLEQKIGSVSQYYHSKYYYNKGLNVCDKKYTRNKDYFIVGTKSFMLYKYNVSKENLLQVKVYIKDIVCIMDNKCLATKKIYVQ